MSGEKKNVSLGHLILILPIFKYVIQYTIRASLGSKSIIPILTEEKMKSR